jgi:rubrerythrin
MKREGEGEVRHFGSVEEVLEFAIGQEEKAAGFYRSFAERATLPGMRKMCQDMAVEEDRHRETLVNLKAGLPSDLTTGRVKDLKVSDYLRSFEIHDEIDQQDLMILAMKSEAKAERLYLDLAEVCDSPEIKEILLRLAAEEGSHKDEFEKEYDEQVQGDN